MASVQFRGLADAVEAFENTGCDAWSLWQGRQFVTKGVGADELTAFLNLLAKNELSSAVYTIAYYESINEKTAINNKTPIDGSFNFYLSDNAAEIKGMFDKRLMLGNDIQSRIGAMENKLDKFIEESQSDDGEENKLGIIGQVLDHPQLGPVVQQLLMKLISGMGDNSQKRNEGTPLAKVAGLPGTTESDTILKSAIDRLKRVDSNLAERLDKLATLAETDPGTYNYIAAMLDKM